MKPAARAWNGAVKAAPAAFSLGLAIGLVAGISAIHTAGAAVILGMTGGALIGLIRR